MRSWNDNEILTGLKNKGERDAAFRALHLQYKDRLKGYLTKLCGGDQDHAEDLLVASLLKAYHFLEKMQGPCRSLQGVLYKVASTVFLDEVRRKKSGGQDPANDALPLLEEVVAGSCPIASEDTDGGRKALLDEARDTLDELKSANWQYGLLLELEYCERVDRSIIAIQTGIQQKQITAYLKRAKGQFQQLARKRPALAALMSK
jgi:RNA polymerase sigma factor (sigma-70 family)